MTISNLPPQNDPNVERRSRNAFRIGIILSIATIIFTLVSIYQTWPIDRRAEVQFLVEDLLVTFAALGSIPLVRRGRVTLAMGILLGSMLITILISPLNGEGGGIVIGLVGLVITFGIASLTMPPRETSWAIVIGGLIGVGTVLIDLFGPENRPKVEDTTGIIITGAIVGLILIGLIAWQFSNYSLRAKLVIAFLMVTLIPLAILGYQNNQSTKQALTENANENHEEDSIEIAETLDEFIESSLNQLQIQAQLPVFVNYLSLPAEERANTEAQTQANATLLVLSQSDPTYTTSYALLDRDGNDFLDTYTPDIGLNKADRDYFRAPFETGEPYVSPLRFSATLPDALSIYFSAPVRNIAGEIIGVLRVRYNAEIIQEIITESVQARGGDAQVILLDENHFYLAHSSNPELIFKSVVTLDEALFRQLQAEGRIPPEGSPKDYSTDFPELEAKLNTIDSQPTFSLDLSGDADSTEVDSVVGTRMSTENWIVLFSEPQELLLEPVTEQTRNSLLFGLVIAGFAAVVGILLAQFLAAPLIRLTQVASEVTAGNFQARAQVEATDEVGELATTFNAMTEQLGSLIGTLEQQVNERTKALNASSEVSQRLSTILDPGQLVKEVVEQVQRGFNYYHTHIYFFDDSRSNLLMVGGTGEAGRIMLANNHRIPAGRGLVGRAAETNQVVLVPETSTDVNWLPNPLLPETKSEVAVPISIGKQVYGVLDVQHNIAGGLRQQDADLLQSIANQVAIAIQNAQSYEVTRRKAEQETIVNSLAQEIQKATRVEDVLEIVAAGLGRTLEVKRVIAQAQNTKTLHGKN